MRGAAWLALLVIGAGPSLFFLWLLTTGQGSVIFGSVLLGLSLIGVVIFLAVEIYMQTTEFGLTDQRIILKRGIISRWTNEIPLQSLENVNLEQTIFSRIFGFGRLEINGSGGSGIITPPLQDPVSFRAVIAEARTATSTMPSFRARARTIDQAHNNLRRL
jgi:uncharacterized membrane protein YdbT with pleckstrin-like domain